MTTSPLRTIADLRLATRRADIPDEDPIALWVLEEASALVCDTAGHPEWEEDPGAAPRAARRIALAVAARTYLNPEFEVASSVGPLSSRHLDLYAYGLNLAPEEREELESFRGGGGNGLGILTLAGGANYDRTLYVRDGQTDHPASNLIPYFDPATSDAGVDPTADVIVP